MIYLPLKEIAIAAMLAISGFSIGKSIAAEPVKNEIPQKYGKISKQEVFWMYTMKTRFWEDGTKITVFYQNFDSPQHKEFCRDVLGVSTDRFATNVETYINKGNAAYFVQVNSPRDVYYQVAKVQGAIGYLSNEFVLINKNGAIVKMKIED
jgi:ABC-type phosphate transport system substrate-binding protein